MARKEQRVTVSREGRDKGKIFLIREMPSDQGERWFYRAGLALVNAGARLPEETLFAGAAGVAAILPTLQNSLAVAIRALQGLHFDDVSPLLDEMRGCIRCVPPGNAPEQVLFPGENCQVEELMTWVDLRLAFLELHLGFSLAGAASITGLESPVAATA